MKLLYIGLPKTGSTVLQQEIFPELSKILGIEYINLYKKLDTKIKFKKKMEQVIIKNSSKNITSTFIFNS